MRTRTGLALACATTGLLALSACSESGISGPTASTAPSPAAAVVIGGGLINVQITDVLNNLDIDIAVTNNNVAVQVCAVVNLLSGVSPLFDFACEIQQGAGGGQGGAQSVGVATQAAAVGPIVIGGGLVNVQVTDVLNNLSVDIDVRNNNVAAQVCAAIEILDTQLGPADDLTCTITQN